MKNSKNILIFSIFLSVFSSFATVAKAVCPVCVVAVGTGVGLCRWLGIDDSISGLWIGGLLASLSIWTCFWLEKKNWAFKFNKIIVPLAYYLLTLFPFYNWEIIGHPLNKFLGIDKLLLGIIFGTAVFLFGYWLDIFLKSKNGGKVFFYYQKVIIPVLLLAIMSAVFYFIIKCY